MVEGGPLPSIQAILGLSGTYRGGGGGKPPPSLAPTHSLDMHWPHRPQPRQLHQHRQPRGPRLAALGAWRFTKIYQDWITRNLVPINWTSPEKDIPSKCRETNTGSLTNKTENVHTRLMVPSMVLACSASLGEVGFHLWGPLTNPGLPLYNAHICSRKM